MPSRIETLRAVAGTIGEDPPTDENEGTDYLVAMLAIWTEVVNDFLTRHAWTWGTQFREITATADTPPKPWLYAYALPVDRTSIKDVRDSTYGYPVDYEIIDQLLYAMEDGPLDAYINIAQTPNYWPADFARAVRESMEGHAWKWAEEFERGERLIDKAEKRITKAIARDKRQNPTRNPAKGTILQAHHGITDRRRPKRYG